MSTPYEQRGGNSAVTTMASSHVLTSTLATQGPRVSVATGMPVLTSSVAKVNSASGKGPMSTTTIQSVDVKSQRLEV